MSEEIKNAFGLFPGASHFGREEIQASTEVIKAKSPFRYYGPDLQYACSQAEQELAKRVAVRHALVLSSGTGALHAALNAIGVKPGDEVVLPAYGWVSDVMAVLAVGAVPVIAPIDLGLGLDPAMLNLCLSEKTKAVVVIHMRGRPANIRVIESICEMAGIPIVEDSAQCFGGSIAGNPVGGLGTVGTFSFQLNKVLTCGEGGALVTNDSDIMQRAQLFQSCGLPRLNSDESDSQSAGRIEDFGLNYRMSELQGSVLVQQLARYESVLSGLRENYHRGLQGLPKVVPGFRELPLPETAVQNHAFLSFTSTNPLEEVCQELRHREISANWCGEIDAHHFVAWEEFMNRKGINFRLIKPEQSFEILKRSAFVDIQSVVHA